MVRQVYNVYNRIRTGWHTDVEVDLNLLENERLGAGIVNWRLRPHPALGPLLLNILAELFFLHESLAAAAAEVVVHVVIVVNVDVNEKSLFGNFQIQFL